MNRAFYVNAKSMADRHVALGNRIIARQRLLIAQLDAQRFDTAGAKALLVTFLTSQRLHENDQQRYNRELAELDIRSLTR